ncbi:MAG: hypothetical protein WC679_00135 [Bacteroidales bacterium]|jgi:hypothetical protein
MSTIKIDGVVYKIRYSYRRDDGTLWYVLDVSGGFSGDFGDEVQVNEVS